MTVREHRGTLADSLATAREVKDRAELCAIIREKLRPFSVDVAPEQISVEPYAYDPRVKSDIYLITIAGYGVWGMAHGPL